jgi:predicted Fe-Mo cluster-binding NifX family protein
MIVAIPTEMDSLNSKISERFARTAYFLIYNTNDDSYEFISHEMQQEHGAGTKIVNELSVRNVEAVISKNIGLNALQALKVGNIKAYIASAGNVKENIDFLKSKKLQEF